jgi:signal recognition particle subunit SRP54
VNKPIKFVGTGEKMEALDVFYPIRMAERILEWEMLCLVERAQEQLMKKKKNSKKIAKTNLVLMIFTQIQQEENG